MEEIKLCGKVFSGKGGGKKFLQLPWVKQQISENLSFTPYLGTLNIKLSSDSAVKRELLENIAAMRVLPAKGYCEGKLFKATIGTVECGIVIPEVEGYPHDLLEVLASENLREKLQLVDGDEMTITVLL